MQHRSLHILSRDLYGTNAFVFFQQSGQQLSLYRRPNGPHLFRYTLLPSTPVPLLRTRPWNVSCCHTWSQDRLPQRNVRPQGSSPRDLR